jgi:hypothetical protein
MDYHILRPYRHALQHAWCILGNQTPRVPYTSRSSRSKLLNRSHRSPRTILPSRYMRHFCFVQYYSCNSRSRNLWVRSTLHRKLTHSFLYIGHTMTQSSLASMHKLHSPSSRRFPRNLCNNQAPAQYIHPCMYCLTHIYTRSSRVRSNMRRIRR